MTQNNQMTRQPKIIHFWYGLPVFTLLIVGMIYTMIVSIDYYRDTTTVGNASFAILATLSALSFSFARVIESDELKDRIMFAGERFLHASIFILAGTLFKYFVFKYIDLPGLIESAANGEKVNIFELGYLKLTVMAFGIVIVMSSLSYGMLFAHTGLRVLNNLLVYRFTRHKDWDHMW